MPNFDNFLDGLDIQLPIQESAGVSVKNPENDKFICESIILDQLGGNKNLLLEFYNEIGSFGARDGIINESAGFDLKLNSATGRTYAETASLLIEGAESGNVNYDIARKALLLFEAAMDKLAEEKGEDAKKREVECTEKCKNNARVVDALEKTKAKGKCDK